MAYAIAVQFRCFIINALSLRNEKPSFFYVSERVFPIKQTLEVETGARGGQEWQ
jgi:hypothetical protein